MADLLAADTTPLWVPLVIGLGGIAGTLLSPVLADWRRSDAADRHWRRDERLDAYADVAKATMTLARSFSNFQEAESANARSKMGVTLYDLTGFRRAFDDALADLDYAVSRAQLLAGNEVGEAAQKVLDYAAGNIYPMTGHGGTVEGFIPPADPLGELRTLHAAFHAASIRELR